ncbi:3-deoxy-7-phosphoheptulonate synthase [Streptomyces umbrinus]|uniref:Phospho-2-dehydro-3-deoxyheptonate aldolase n=1 Tax=Streptomyces umbrinus TaxID=67370 RepID=A0ABU0SNE3_9ACTN|nr:3-deoxy-7-phosphoheptulonate synthase [Streptomyces umbrinus]MDQ1025045.1 3-deoxy-7-phosphoheptulonate synthase [Streptomyces umbrinus]
MTDFEAVARLRSYPPLVFAGECDLLSVRLARVARGEAVLLQGEVHGRDRAGVTADVIRARLRTLLQMALVLTYAASVPVVKIGRIPFRDPEPSGMVRMYEVSAATLNLVRALTTGYADLRQVHEWNRDFVAGSPARGRHVALVDEIDRALAFMRACGLDPAGLSTVEFFASHACVPLAYESALTRVDSRTGQLYNTSRHFVRTGEHIWNSPGAHGDYLDYLAAIRNPLGVEIGPGTGPDDALGLLDRLNPAREPGRLTFLVRMGPATLRDKLPALVEKVTAEDHQVGWICDPAPVGPRHRRFDDILDEVTACFEVHRALGIHPAGLTVDLTGDGSMALDLAFLVAELYRGSAMGLHPAPR